MWQTELHHDEAATEQSQARRAESPGHHPGRSNRPCCSSPLLWSFGVADDSCRSFPTANFQPFYLTPRKAASHGGMMILLVSGV
jgi:hypothetical protein